MGLGARPRKRRSREEASPGLSLSVALVGVDDGEPWALLGPLRGSSSAERGALSPTGLGSQRPQGVGLGVTPPDRPPS